MGSIFTWIAVLYAYAIAASFFAVLFEPIAKRIAVMIAVFSGYAACFAIVIAKLFGSGLGSGGFGDAPVIAGVLLMTFGSVACLIPFIAVCIGGVFEYTVRSYFGLDRMKAPATYDLAEKAFHEKNYDAAIQHYMAYAAKVPDDPVPFQRVADIYFLTNRVELGLTSLRRAFELTKDPETKLVIAIRIAEKMQPQDARVFLRKARSQFTDARILERID